MSVSSLAEYLLSFRAGLGRVKGKELVYIVTIYTKPSVLVACPTRVCSVSTKWGPFCANR